MRYAIISDVHANLEALQSVLITIKKENPDAVWFLGDIVGYGPNPNECIKILRKETQIFLAGNHDHAVIGITDIEYFNPYAKEVIEWTTEILSDRNKEFLRSLPIFKSLKITDETFVSQGDTKGNKENPPLPPFSKGGQGGFGDVYLVHSTPKEPEQWHYILNTWDAYINFQFFTERICFVGHSHYPFIAEMNPEGDISVYKDYADIKEGCRYIVNVGSVGQPRDGNSEAAYALLTQNSIEVKRVPYDIVSIQKKMREAGLPPYLIERLARGR
ncbi:MAG: metallophosphoesterase family protein [Nitrospirae bacterium]|nr:metallophosphoesterase family protein [Nitrospirota bacterium]